MSNNIPSKFETEAVILELEKEHAQAKCKLKPAAGASFVEIGENKYLVGRQSPAPTSPVHAKLWPLDPAGLTEAFELGESPNEGDSGKHGNSLEQWALAAWQAQRKVRILIDANKITKITLL